jgi:dienelactone hydrolase
MVTGMTFPQANPRQIGSILDGAILPPELAIYQLREYLINRVAPPPAPTNSAAWSAESKHLRDRLLREVVFHGWPAEWVNSPPKFEDLGVIKTGQGYRMRKLRYEIVPGFMSTAILYEPEKLEGKVPAILNVNGHVFEPGKAIEYKQQRCINFAKRGIMALNLEWLGMGELGQPENAHWVAPFLDLVGTHELGLFYLEMRRGLDYLADHPNVDPARLGMTGLSGGGWQTIILSSLDERVAVSVPVAGFSSNRNRVEVNSFGDLGDPEQFPTDMYDGIDLPHLVAMRAPRPTLLIYNAEDDACFRASIVKPLIYDALLPTFKLYGKEDALGWHENMDPATHNYQLDNRLQAYRFFSKYFNLPPIDSEIPSAAEIKSVDELRVGLPENNLTILGLARKLAAGISRPPIPSEESARKSWAVSERARLRTVVRYKPVNVASTWEVAITKSKGIESKSYLFHMGNGLSATGVWLRAIEAPDDPPLTIVLNDRGKKASSVEVSDRVNRGEQVLALDLMFTGDEWKQITQGPFNGPIAPYLYAQILHGLGDRPLGMQAAQLVAIAKWFQKQGRSPKVRLEITGMRNQVSALVASALEPDLFSIMVVHEGIRSLGYVLEAPVSFQEAPELFCLDFYKQFDLDRLTAMAAPVKVTIEKFAEKDTPR